jgi:dTDP-4-dehydrorhamnose reductase
MRILLTGPMGQVGSALAKTLPYLGEAVNAGRAELDLAKPDSIRDCVRSIRPEVIVNTAAYTAVDRAESEEALAMAVNRDGPAGLAAEAARCGALLVHFSTDYVFDGEKSSPYVETDPPHPLNAYGRSKLAGEQAIQDADCRYLILRTSWVYSETGKNFLLTMLRLARDKKELRVVDDQYGAPTSSTMIASATLKVISRAIDKQFLAGIYHMTAGGTTTWYGFAQAIFRERKMHVAVTPISSKDFPSPARRPPNSMLDNSKLAKDFGVELPAWDMGLRDVLAKVG